MKERNWKEYDKRLIRRGEIWIDRGLFGWIKERVKRSKRGKKIGRPYKYKPSFMRFIIILRYIFKLAYRQTEGFIRSIFKRFNIDIPDYRTIWYRTKRMEIKYDMGDRLKDDAIIVLDSTGIKITNRGDWMRSRKRVSNRRGWVKVHVAYNIETGEIVDFEVTDESGQDCKEGLKILKRLVEKYKRSGKRIKKVIGDAGYDTHEIFNYLSEQGIEAVIKLRRNAKLTNNLGRSRIIRYMRDSGKGWGRELGYNKRWSVESFFSAYKRVFGEGVSGRSMDTIKKEIFLKLLIMNSFYSYSNLTN